MIPKSKKNRRQFLKNTTLASLALGLSTNSAQACNTPKRELDSLMCDKTTLDYFGEGPFYTDNPPEIQNGQLAVADEPGDRMIITGRVFNLDCSEYIPNTLIDVWHANDAGQYDNNGFNLRGQTYSNSQGFYMFETIKPGKYQNGSSFRPAHIHFKITPPGFDELTTQLYFEGDADLESDAASSITSGQYDASHRIIPLEENSEGKLEGTWDIIINGDGITSAQSIHLDKGIIYRAGPNPFSNRISIMYGVFRRSKVSLEVFDLQGRLVANLEERNLSPEKYEAVWEPDAGLANGHYFIALKINDLQVHYLKVIRQS